MTTGADEQSQDDILAEILDEFMSVVRRGENPDAAQAVAKFPHLEAQIRELLPLVSLVEEVHPKLPNVAAAAADAPRQLGPYRIISELGRGGMGVVYRAVHAGLGRQVALKVLPKSLVGNDDHRTRFLREASAAASLHHTNIVPVFEVGEDGDTCFYAMQFIEGTGLNVVRDRLRDAASDGNVQTRAKDSSTLSQLQATVGAKLLSGSTPSSASSKRPYFDSVARVGVQVADALQFAHSRGIVHRDVKPANLILDPAGVVWLTDFGLAKMEDVDLTGTGQVVGTTRYVSPERFRGECTALSDVYALGATLYELLTLRSAFDARGHLQLIDQITSKEPTRLREIDRRIPRDLETIVLKALEKEPKRRYQSAFEMMEDLRRFCACEPVKARPVSALERGLKWVRRRPAVSALATLVLLVGTTGFTVSSLKWAEAVRERDERAAAQELAEANLVKARTAVQRMLTHVGDVRLSNIPHMEKLRAQLLQEALKFNQGFVTNSDKPDVEAEVGMTHGRLGDIHLMLAEPEKALRAFRAAYAIFAELHADNPEHAGYHINQAASLSNCALARMAIGQTEEAEADCVRAIATANEVLRNHPSDDSAVSQLFVSSVRLANIHEQSGRLEESVAAMRSALQVFDRLSAAGQGDDDNCKLLVQARTMLASSLLQLDQTPEAKSVLDQAIRSARNLIAQSPNMREYRDALGNAEQMQYAVLRKLGEREQARELIQQATDTFESLARDYPHFTEYKQKFSNSAIGLAISYAEAGDQANAEPAFIKGVQMAWEIAQAFPSDVGFQIEAAGATRMTGIFFQNFRQLDKAEEYLLDAGRRLENLVENAPNNPTLRLDLAKTAHALGTNFRATGDLQNAIHWTRRAIKLEESVLVEMNRIPIVRHKLCQEYRQLGELLLQEKNYGEAHRHLERAVEIQRGVVKDAPENVEYHRHLAIALHRLADWYREKQMPDAMLPFLEESIAIRVRLGDEQPLWFSPQVELPPAYRELGLALEKLNRHDDALAGYEQSLVICERLMPDHRTDLNLREEYARCLESKMRWLISAQQGQEAARTAQRALEVRKETLQIVPNDENVKSALADLQREVSGMTGG